MKIPLLALSILCLLISCTSNPSKPDRKPDVQITKTPVVLIADLAVDPYTNIQNILGTVPEVPDCGHEKFGPHITQIIDEELKLPVFVFHLHVSPDNDRCIKFDRQRTEIRTGRTMSTFDYIKGFNGESVNFRWRFKLDKSFKPSFSFTHLHQIKAVDGDDDMPLLTLTARKGSPDKIEIIHVDSKNRKTILHSDLKLKELAGHWIEAFEKITYGPSGSYSITLLRMSDRKPLLSYSVSDLDLWRTNTTNIRPKWGIYRSLEQAQPLRDEQVRFQGFCLAKGPDECVEKIFEAR